MDYFYIPCIFLVSFVILYLFIVNTFLYQSPNRNQHNRKRQQQHQQQQQQQQSKKKKKNKQPINQNNQQPLHQIQYQKQDDNIVKQQQQQQQQKQQPVNNNSNNVNRNNGIKPIPIKSNDLNHHREDEDVDKENHINFLEDVSPPLRSIPKKLNNTVNRKNRSKNVHRQQQQQHHLNQQQFTARATKRLFNDYDDEIDISDMTPVILQDSYTRELQHHDEADDEMKENEFTQLRYLHQLQEPQHHHHQHHQQHHQQHNQQQISNLSSLNSSFTHSLNSPNDESNNSSIASSLDNMYRSKKKYNISFESVDDSSASTTASNSNSESESKPSSLLNSPKINGISSSSSLINNNQKTNGIKLINGLKPVHLNHDILYLFWNRSIVNTNNGVETGALLCGVEKEGQYFVTTLLFPPQVGRDDSFDCSEDEAVLAYQLDNKLITLGWIHSHPTQTVFLSSVDIHNHYAQQVMLPESIAIVVSPKPTPNFEIFHLKTPDGMNIISMCNEKGFHPHDQKDSELYQPAQHVNNTKCTLKKEYQKLIKSIIIKDFRKDVQPYSDFNHIQFTKSSLLSPLN